LIRARFRCEISLFPFISRPVASCLMVWCPYIYSSSENGSELKFNGHRSNTIYYTEMFFKLNHQNWIEWLVGSGVCVSLVLQSWLSIFNFWVISLLKLEKTFVLHRNLWR